MRVVVSYRRSTDNRRRPFHSISLGNARAGDPACSAALKGAGQCLRPHLDRADCGSEVGIVGRMRQILASRISTVRPRKPGQEPSMRARNHFPRLLAWVLVAAGLFALEG